MNKKLQTSSRVVVKSVLTMALITSTPISALANHVFNQTNSSDWTQVWADEFNNDSLDMTKWSYDTGNWIVDENGNGVSSGWGNEELEYYTAGDNLSFDGENLIITAKKEQASDQYGNYDYTSSRIKTKGNFAKKYGRIEARMQLPKGDGLWPAFWMLPEDDVYGGWAASGEIDIMEARGRTPEQVEGTLHYGGLWPNNRYSGGHYNFPEGEDITGFHEYAIEWEPGEIRWYVDDILYQTQKNWQTKSVDGEEKYAFPAPFDQNFHILLNLAVGGWFDNGVVPSEDFEMAQMLVDYVRVYELTGREYLQPQEPIVEKEPIPEFAKKTENGNYIYDVPFAEGLKVVNQNEIALSEDKWNLLTLPQFNGAATATIVNNMARIEFTQPGSQTYSTQMIQHVPSVKGHTYKISYTAKTDKKRNMVVKVSGGEDRGWSTYSEVFDVSLTPEFQTYEHIFTMNDETDVMSRLEFNMGLDTNTITIGDVKVEETELIVDYDGPKSPLKNGNYVYNGQFDKGNIDRKTYWNLVLADNAAADYSVAEATRELMITPIATNQKEDIVLQQKGIQIDADGQYQLEFSGRTTAENTNISAVLQAQDGTIIDKVEIGLTPEMKTHTVVFATNQELSATDYQGSLSFFVGGEMATMYLDDIMLTNTEQKIVETGFVNGDFSQGKAGWAAWDNYVYDDFIDQITIESEVAVLPIAELSAASETWHAQFKQTGLQLQRGVEYELSFDISSDLAREAEVVVQNSGYYRVYENRFEITPEVKTHTTTFVATGTEEVELNFLLGQYSDEAYPAHTVKIDNVIFAPTTVDVDLAPTITGVADTIIFQNQEFDVRENVTAIDDEDGDLTSQVTVEGQVNSAILGTYPIIYRVEDSAGNITEVTRMIRVVAEGTGFVNGDFSQGKIGWTAWNNLSNDNYLNEIMIEDEIAVLPILTDAITRETWFTQFKQAGLILAEGETYELSFDISSDLAREAEVVVQNSGYYRVYEDRFEITPEVKTHTATFVVTGTEEVELNFLLGNFSEENYPNHIVKIDNVQLINVANNTPKVDKTKLIELMAVIRTVDLTGYTLESIALLDTALVNAQIVIDNVNATQAEVETAITQLTIAFEQLVEKQPEIGFGPDGEVTPEVEVQNQNSTLPNTGDQAIAAFGTSGLAFAAMGAYLFRKRKC